MEWKGRLYRFKKGLNWISELYHHKDTHTDTETESLTWGRVCGPWRDIGCCD
ncbi:hypothetical protein AOLI_G00072250 [Acnodon oligacanthus]